MLLVDVMAAVRDAVYLEAQQSLLERVHIVRRYGPLMRGGTKQQTHRAADGAEMGDEPLVLPCLGHAEECEKGGIQVRGSARGVSVHDRVRNPAGIARGGDKTAPHLVANPAYAPKPLDPR